VLRSFRALVAAIHRRFLPVIVGLLGSLAFFFWRRLRGVPGCLVLGFAGLGAYVAAIGLEAVVYLLPSMAEWGEAEASRYRGMTTIEEAFEFFGTTAIAASALRYPGTFDEEERA